LKVNKEEAQQKHRLDFIFLLHMLAESGSLHFFCELDNLFQGSYWSASCTFCGCTGCSKNCTNSLDGWIAISGILALFSMIRHCAHLTILLVLHALVLCRMLCRRRLGNLCTAVEELWLRFLHIQHNSQHATKILLFHYIVVSTILF